MRIKIHILLLLTVLNTYAQTDTICKHIVERGETLSSIALLYSTTETELRKLNPVVDEHIYVGIELNVPARSSTSQLSSSINSVSETINSLLSIQKETALDLVKAECSEADALLREGENKKAAKAYSKIIEQYENTSHSCVEAYYGRAIAYYNRGKWKDAIKDLESVLGDSRCSKRISTHCRNLLADARQHREEQLNNRGQLWGSLFAAAALTTATVIATNSGDGGMYSNTRVSGGSDMNYLLDPNYAMQQVNAQNEAEYQQMKQYNPSLTREQFMQMKAEAYAASKSTENGTASTRSSSSQSNSSTSSSKPKRKDCPALKTNPKMYCANTGDCAKCLGDGWMSSGFGLPDIECTYCKGSGKCSYCNQ